MGSVLACRLKLDGKRYEGTALLETEHLEFKGGTRLKIPFKSITGAVVEENALKISFDDREAVFLLGDAADKWLHKILHPKGLLDKLGVKPEHAVAVMGIKDDDFLRQLRDRAKKVHSKLATECEVIFFGAEKTVDLAALKKYKTAIKKDGAI